MSGLKPRTKPLPRGRHSLPPEEVASTQRERLIAAMIEVVARKGYADTRVGDVIEAAKVSRATYYQIFSDKEEGFLAAYDFAVTSVVTAAEKAFREDPKAPWIDRMRAALGALLDAFADERAMARVCLVEVLAAGPKALARRDAAIRQLAQLVDAGRAEAKVELPGMASVAVVGGINELLYSEVLHGAIGQLPNRLPELVFWVAQPFLGEKQADRARERAQKWMEERAAGTAA